MGQALDRSELLALFNFSHAPPEDTDVEWRDASTLQLRLGPLGHTAAFRPGVSWARLFGTVRSAGAPAGVPPASRANLTLTGSFGDGMAPRLVSFLATDYDNADDVFSDGDSLELAFDRYTSASGTLDDRQEVDRLLSFTSPIGADYSGEWHDCIDATPPAVGSYCRAVRITITDASLGSRDDPPAFGHTLVTVNPPADPPLSG